MSLKKFDLDKLMMDRRGALAFGAGSAGTLALFGLAACDASAPAPSDKGKDGDKDENKFPGVDAKAFDDLVAAGAVADEATIAASKWASAIKDAGKLRLGGTKTSTLFSLYNERDNTLRGFDAGLAQLLTRYILGDQSKYDFTLVTSDTRESVLQNNQVDCVIATYSITDARKKLISFAGPYYKTQQAIMVMADNDAIKGLDDLAGKNVACQSGSTGPNTLAQYAPDAHVQEFSTDEEARSALAQGRVDAYVIDQNLQLSSLAKQPGRYKLVGEPFGKVDPYGIGLPLDSDGVDFVNAFLTGVIDRGVWMDLWKICIGDTTHTTVQPDVPAVGTV